MTNWRTTIGGAISATGTTLFGVGTVVQFTDVSHDIKNTLIYIAIAGFLMSAVGKGVTSFFAADAQTLKDVVNQTNVNTIQIADTKTKLEETQFIKKDNV